MTGRAIDERVGAVRSFSRFYTNRVGVLREGLLRTPYSLTESRLLFELAQRDTSEVVELRSRLDIDSGYLSRILSRFESDGLVARERSASDGRRQVISLTERGREEFETLDSRSAAEIRDLLTPLADEDQRRLVEAMDAVRGILEDARRRRPFTLRPLRPGDLGWVVQRHGVIYAEEYGLDDTFEPLVARIVAEYVERRDPRRERAWIAEVDGTPVGCVFCVAKNEHVAQLRLLLVEASARGTGVGARLVEECVSFAREAGYRELVLWTNDVLVAARRIYERAGFRLVEEEEHHSFGRDLVGQNWLLEL